MAPALGFNIQDYYNNNKINKKQIEEINKYLEDENLPNDCDGIVATFLSATNKDPENAKVIAREYFRNRIQMKEFFTGRKMDDEKVNKQWNVMGYFVAPERIDGETAVHLIRFNDPSASKFSLDYSTMISQMCIDQIMYDAPLKSLILIFDLKQFSLMHLFKLQMGVLKNLMKYSGDVMLPCFKTVYFINGGYVVEKLFKILKIITKPELMDKMICMPSSMDWNEFYANHIPKKYLPSDYGGDLPPMDDLQKDLGEKLRKLEPYFDEDEKMLNSFRSKK